MKIKKMLTSAATIAVMLNGAYDLTEYSANKFKQARLAYIESSATRLGYHSQSEYNAALAGKPSLSIEALLRQSATEEGINPALLISLAKNESAFNPKAVSGKGAVGILQLLPATGKEFGVKNPKDLFDPKINIPAGARKFKSVLTKWKHPELAIIAYNGGDVCVQKKCPEGINLANSVLTQMAKAN